MNTRLMGGMRLASIAAVAVWTGGQLLAQQPTDNSTKKPGAKKPAARPDPDTAETRALAAPDDPSTLLTKPKTNKKGDDDSSAPVDKPVKSQSPEYILRVNDDPFADTPQAPKTDAGKTGDKTKPADAPATDAPKSTGKATDDTKPATGASGAKPARNGKTLLDFTTPDKGTDEKPADDKTTKPTSKPAGDDLFGNTPKTLKKDSDNPFEESPGKPSTSAGSADQPKKSPLDLPTDIKPSELELSPAQALLKKGQDLIDAGKYKQAIDPIKQSIKMAPTDATGPYQLGIAYRMLGEYDDAIDAFSDALKQDAELGDAYLRRGVCWYYKGEYNLAAADFEDAAGVNYNDPRPLTWKGITLAQRGQLRDAVNAYSQALRFDNRYSLAHVNRGLSYIALQEYDKAVDDFDQAIRSSPKDSNLYVRRGIAQAGSGDWQAAVRSYTAAIRLDPKNAEAYIDRGWAYQQLGDQAKAAADTAKGRELQSTGNKVSTSR